MKEERERAIWVAPINPLWGLFPWMDDRGLVDRVAEEEPMWSPEPIEAWRYSVPRIGGVVRDLRQEAHSVYEAVHGTDWAPAAQCDRWRSPLTATERSDLHDDRSPSPHCSCGYYAVKTREQTMRGVISTFPEQWIYRVELAGRVIEHEHGYRAELIRVVEKMRIADSPGEYRPLDL